MRRLAWICVFFGLLICGCSSQTDKPDESPAVEQTPGGEAFPMEVPEGTFMLARMDMAQVRTAYDHVDSLIRAAMDNAPENQREQVPTIAAPVKVGLTFLMTMDGRPGRVLDDPTNVSDDYMDGLAEDGTVFAAISTVGNDSLMRALENRVPASGPETVPRGYFVRLYLPASDPDRLATWLEGLCDAGGLSCGESSSIRTVAEGVVFDYRLGDPSGLFEQFGVDPTLAAPGDDETFFGERTAALEAFMGTESALGLYVRSDRLAELGALQGMTEAFQAVASATPENKQALYHRGMSLAGGVFEMLSPEAREVGDSALMLRVTDELGFVADSVRGFTEVGAEVAEAGVAEVTAGSVDGGGLLEAQVAYDLSEARRASVTPGWMRMGSERDARDIARMLRYSGIWGYGLAAHNYPAGFGRGVTNLAMAEGDEAAMIASQTEHLEAIRLSLDARASTSTPMGVEPSGAIVAVFDRRADVERWVAEAQRQAGAAPFPVSLEVVEREETKEVHVLLGDDVSVGDPTPVPSTIAAALDLVALGGLVGDANQRGMQARMMQQVASPVLAKLERVDVTSTRGSAGFHLRLNVGGIDVPEFAFAEGVRPTPQPTGGAACLQEARGESRRAQSALQHARPTQRADLMVNVADELESKQANCSDHADEIEWMRARWLEQAGIMMANGLRWARAIDAFESGCALGDERTCELAKRAKSPEIGVTLPSVSAPVSTWVGQRGQIPVLGPSYVDTWQFQWPLGLAYESKQQLGSVDWSDERARRDVVRMLGEPSSVGFPILVDEAADAKVLAYMAEYAKEAQNRGRLRYQRSNNQQLGLLIPVKVDGRPQLGLIKLFPPGDSRQPHIRLEVGSDGVDMSIVERGVRAPVDPIDGCPADGPTVCAEDASKMTAGSLRIDTVVEQVRTLELDPAPAHATIAVEEGVPFQVVAELAQQLEALRLKDSEDLVIRLDPDSKDTSIR